MCISCYQVQIFDVIVIHNIPGTISLIDIGILSYSRLRNKVWILLISGGKHTSFLKRVLIQSLINSFGMRSGYFLQGFNGTYDENHLWRKVCLHLHTPGSKYYPESNYAKGKCRNYFLTFSCFQVQIFGVIVIHNIPGTISGLFNDVVLS